MTDISEVLGEAVARANDAIATLEATGAFRYDGLTLEQWLEARDSYLSQQSDIVNAHISRVSR